MSSFIVIPAYNEAKTIESVLKKVKKYSKNIVVVDDGSNDQTKEKARQAGVIVLSHILNLGKGATLKTGCDYALKQGAKKIVVMDADDQHEAADIPIFAAKLDEVDIVFSYRKQANAMPLILKFGNRVINEILYRLFKIKVYDSQCGFRAFRASVYPSIRWKENGYFMETEMIIRAAKANLSSAQLPIKTIYGDKYKGTTVLDGIVIVAKMILWRFFK